MRRCPRVSCARRRSGRGSRPHCRRAGDPQDATDPEPRGEARRNDPRPTPTRCAEIPNGWVGTEPRHREEVVELIRDLRPRLVLAPYPEDRHPDHAAGGKLVREACFLASIGRFSSGSPHRPAALYHHTVHHPLAPSFVVDVTAVWSRKMDAVRAYQSQFEPGPHEAGTEIGSEAFLAFLEARSRVLRRDDRSRTRRGFLLARSYRARCSPRPS
jgi:hypothetical protein